jgi:hypothetical protein
MLGENPQAFGVPELNLFATDRLEELLMQSSDLRQIQLHGLLRTVAHLYAGEQSISSIDMARRWMLTRVHWTTGAVYQEICRKVWPLRIVDKSPVYCNDPRNLARIGEAFPNAQYVHLLRHPLTQGRSVMQIANGIMAAANSSVDHSTNPPTVDPQIMWLRTQRAIMAHLETIPSERWVRIRGEDVLAAPGQHFPALCRWLGLAFDENALSAMLRPERSPFACLGPLSAHLGNDINFLKSPRFKPQPPAPARLEGPLPWRPDGKPLSYEVGELARGFGYE